MLTSDRSGIEHPETTGGSTQETDHLGDTPNTSIECPEQDGAVQPGSCSGGGWSHSEVRTSDSYACRHMSYRNIATLLFRFLRSIFLCVFFIIT